MSNSAVVADNLIFKRINKDKVLVFNSLTYNPIILNNMIYECIKDLNGEEIVVEDAELFSTLLESHILKNKNDIINIKDTYTEGIESLSKNSAFQLRFIPSYDCDQYCSYCLVDERRKITKEHFKKEWLNNLSQIITKSMDLSPLRQYSKVEATLIGGEPTLEKNWDICCTFLEVLNKNFNSEGHTLVTNGYGINRELLNKFKLLGGKNVYISYDIRGGKSDFTQPHSRLVFDKFKLLAKTIINNELSITVDLKIDEDSLSNEYTTKILDFLCILEKYGNINVVCSPIISEEEYNPLITPHIGKYDLLLMEKNNILEVYKYVLRALPKSLSWPDISEVMIYRCNTAYLSSLTIFPDGKVSCCGKLYASVNNVPYVGDLSKGFFDENIFLSYLRSPLDDEECKKCEYILLCGGKCVLCKDKLCDQEKKAVDLFLNMWIEKFNLLNKK